MIERPGNAVAQRPPAVGRSAPRPYPTVQGSAGGVGGAIGPAGAESSKVFRNYPAYPASIQQLRSWGVHIMDQAPIPQGLRIASWEAILAEVTRHVAAKQG